MATHKGGCHCGRVQYEVDAPEDLQLDECNCTICTMAGYRHLVVERDRFRLLAGEETPPEVALFYEHVCPAGVYESSDGKLVVNAPNCVDCKATDVLGPRWAPREGGSGPAYKRM